MKTLYIDCGMGAAGDMLTAALLELLPDAEAFVNELNALGIPGVSMRQIPSMKCGIKGTHFEVKVNGVEEESHDHHEHEHGHEHGHHHHHEHEHEHHHHHHDHDHDHDHEHDHHHDHDHGHTHSHNGLHEIEHLVRGHLPISEKVKNDIMAVYSLIAEAESHAHNAPISEVHFHEVGSMDAVADITAVCMLMDRLEIDEVIVSPVHVGSGKVRCAHGILPVPAPATAYILKDVPIYSGEIKGELCTPTGAALLKHFAARFGSMPVMKVKAVGYGMGKKDFEAANCVRVMLGETEAKKDAVLELSCNVDDMTPEQISFAMERLFEGGALDVYTIPIGMKKSRTGALVRVMCREEDKEHIIELIFKYTSTIGIRQTDLQRYVLDRSIKIIETPYGTVRRKDVKGYGVARSKYEYEDLARIAREQEKNIDEIKDLISKYDVL